MTTNPIRWRPDDLGQPIPDDPYAASVCLPTWQDVIGYEEGEPRVRSALRAGYPRFMLPPQVTALHEARGPGWLAFASPEAARRAADHVAARGGKAVVEDEPATGLAWVRAADEASRKLALEIWRFAGEGISGRTATAAARGEKWLNAAGNEARAEIRARLAGEHDVPESCVHLFGSGMAAVSTVHRLFVERTPGAGTVQVDFPYVDVLRVQNHLGPAKARCLSGAEAAMGGLARALADGFRAGVFFEIPANPLLACADLPGGAAVCRAAGVPVAADDTVAGSRNVRLLQHADLVTTSLTKWFNGRCNLLAGSVVVNPSSPFADEFQSWLHAAAGAPLGDADAAELARNSRGYEQRMVEVNRTAEAVIGFLRAHPRVVRLWYPDTTPGGNFDRVRRPGGGAGGLLSFALQGGEAEARRFYDRVRLNKGPSLGADFSLLCPYTLLAHYDELDHAAAWGATRDLLRLSVGREDPDDLTERLSEALG